MRVACSLVGLIRTAHLALLLGITLLLDAAPLVGQTTAPTLEPADYEQWESLGAATLDPTGRWVVVSVRTVGGDTELRLYPASATGDTEGLVLDRGTSPTFTDDGGALVYIRGADPEAEEASKRNGFP